MHNVGTAFRQQFAYTNFDKISQIVPIRNALRICCHGWDSKLGSSVEMPVNMKQANLAQKDNLSQSQLLHTQNDRQMKTQAAGKQVKASEGRERERYGCSWNSSSGTMMQQT